MPFLPQRASQATQRHTQEEASRGHLFLFTKTLLSDMLDKKKKLQPQSSYAKMIEEHAIIFHTSRTFNEFSFKVTAAFITFLFHIKIHHILKIP